MQEEFEFQDTEEAKKARIERMKERWLRDSETHQEEEERLS